MTGTITDSQRDRGQVGIGTLIVFIAMVLVAAIAAGVLINTAGFLQSSAEATGEDATSQVSENIDVVSSLGNDSTESDAINQINLTVKLGSGSDPLNLTNTELHYVGPDTVVTTDLDDDDIERNNLVGDRDDVIEDTSQRIDVGWDLDDSSDGFADASELEPGESAELTLTTESGAQTFETLRVGDPINTPEDL